MSNNDRERLSVTLAREHVENGHRGDYKPYCYRCQAFDAWSTAQSWEWLAITKPRAWKTSWPALSRLVGLGDDEYRRRTVWIGPWVVALWRCRCGDCRDHVARLESAWQSDAGQEDRDKQPGRWTA